MLNKVLREHNLEEEDEQFRRRPTTIQQWYNKTFWVWIFVIVVGLVASMFRSATMSDARERRIITAEFATTILLDLEMALRFTVNWRRFHRSRRNLVDLIIAVMSTILLLPPIRNSSAYGWLSIFAILRVYRVVWAVPSTRHLLASIRFAMLI
jgi:voltage-dependent calcium channel